VEIAALAFKNGFNCHGIIVFDADNEDVGTAANGAVFGVGLGGSAGGIDGGFVGFAAIRTEVGCGDYLVHLSKYEKKIKNKSRM